jgi:hypothetical protein
MSRGKSGLFQSKNNSLRSADIQDSVSEMHTWMRNLEQNVMSVSARLGAVENRISIPTMISDGKQRKERNNVDKSDNSQEASIAESTIKQFHQMSEELQKIIVSLKENEKKLDALQAFKVNTEKELQGLHGQKQSHTMVMKLGEKEIPLELTGIMGGMISFGVALMLFLDLSEVVLSPLFLVGIGGLFLLSSLLRTRTGGSFIKKIMLYVFPHSQKSTVHHSDSTS